MDTKKLRQKILDLAIHGKLVPQDPNDEPASVLLERIRAEKEMLIKEGKIKAPKKSKSAGDTSHYPKDVPFEVPEGWVWTTIGDILINRDGERIPVSSAIRKKQNAKLYDYYGAAGVIDKVDDYLFNERLLLVGEDGANLLSRSKDNAFFAEGKYWVNNHAHIIDASDKRLLDYIALYINAIPLDMYVTGSAQPKLNQDNLNRISVPLPPLAEQFRIVQAVEECKRIVNGIENNQIELQEAIDQTKQKILSLAIAGKLVSQDPSDEPAIVLMKRINPAFQASDNLHYEGELPNGWCFSTIGDLFRHNTGKALNGKDQVGEELRYITTSNLYWDRFDLNEVRTMPFTEAEKEKCRATKGDLLVCEGGDVGRAAIWPHDFDVMIQNHIHRLRPREDISVRFYYYIFLLYKQMGLIGGKGIAILGLSSRELDKMVVPVPPVPEQHRIVTVIENLFAQMDALISNLS